MSGPMADWADKAAIELLRSIGMQGGLYSLVPPVAVALRKARREGMEAALAVAADFNWVLPLYVDCVRNEASDDAAEAVCKQIAAAIQSLLDQEPA